MVPIAYAKEQKLRRDGVLGLMKHIGDIINALSLTILWYRKCLN